MNEETLYHEALAKATPGERSAFLDRACAGQPEKGSPGGQVELYRSA